MPWSPEERRQLGTELDEVQRRLKIVLRYCLYALILLVTGFAVVLFRAFAHDASRAFLNLYGGVAYLAFLAWAVGKLRALRPRPSDPPPSDLPDVQASFGRDKDTGAWKLSFRLGAPDIGAGPGGAASHPPPETGASSPGSDAAGPDRTDAEARAASIVFWLVLGTAVLALVFALWTLGWIPSALGYTRSSGSKSFLYSWSAKRSVMPAM